MREHLGDVVEVLRERHHADGGALLEEEVHQGLGGRLAGLPRERARVSPSSSRRRHVAIMTWSKPTRALRDGAPALAVDQALLDDALPRRPVAEPLEQLRQAAVVHPGRQQVVHLGAARVVGIHVAAHVDAARPRVVDQAEHRVHLPPVLAPAHLDVGDLHADAALLPDADGLADGASTIALSPRTWEK